MVEHGAVAASRCAVSRRRQESSYLGGNPEGYVGGSSAVVSAVRRDYVVAVL